jgi:hypothetical protein
MSVQNGRCVVTFNQADQEVVKGVADYLRYAGEERIKKWRRHVRMVGKWLCGWLEGSGSDEGAKFAAARGLREDPYDRQVWGLL